jgi:hypothetical protein
MRRFIVLLAAFALLAALPVSAAARPGPTSARGVDPAIAYWTAERIAHAIPRDFVRNSNGKFVPAAKPGGSGSGASWTAGGEILERSGRVLFTLGGVDYICSASVVDDGGDANYSVIVTAAHCAYDEVADVFATNWVYYPAFDTSPSYTCSQATYGCWVGRALVVHHGFADREAFDDIAVQYDWAFAVVQAGGNGTPYQVDSFGAYAVNVTTTTGPNPGWAFGYPAAGKYHGKDLTYCTGAVGTDPYNNDNNWKLVCDMTGGSSGGPWLRDTTNPASATSPGAVFSLNSYGYSGVKAMHGPKFNANTTTSYNAAKAATPDASGIDGILVP